MFYNIKIASGLEIVFFTIVVANCYMSSCDREKKLSSNSASSNSINIDQFDNIAKPDSFCAMMEQVVLYDSIRQICKWNSASFKHLHVYSTRRNFFDCSSYYAEDVLINFAQADKQISNLIYNDRPFRKFNEKQYYPVSDTIFVTEFDKISDNGYRMGLARGYRGHLLVVEMMYNDSGFVIKEFRLGATCR